MSNDASLQRQIEDLSPERRQQIIRALAGLARVLANVKLQEDTHDNKPHGI